MAPARAPASGSAHSAAPRPLSAVCPAGCALGSPAAAPPARAAAVSAHDGQGRSRMPPPSRRCPRRAAPPASRAAAAARSAAPPARRARPAARSSDAGPAPVLLRWGQTDPRLCTRRQTDAGHRADRRTVPLVALAPPGALAGETTCGAGPWSCPPRGAGTGPPTARTHPPSGEHRGRPDTRRLGAGLGRAAGAEAQPRCASEPNPGHTGASRISAPTRCSGGSPGSPRDPTRGREGADSARQGRSGPPRL